jgi:hypothetical protein
VAEAPNFSGGYAGEPTFQGGGGYDPFDPKNYKGPVAPDFRGGYAGEPTAPGGGGFDPASARNTGGVAETAKPDGTKVLPNAMPSNVGTGTAARTTGTIPTSPFGTTEAAAVTPSILQSQSKQAGSPTAPSLSSIKKNALELFASYSPIWTMAVLEREQFNNPPSYRGSPSQLKHIILSSAGRFESNRAQTTSGIPEFYINNFTMKSVIAPGEKTGNSNAFKFEWDIYEPYSMGLLLQSLQVASNDAGYTNYISDTPFVLRLDFVGYDELGRNYTTIKPKFFVLKVIGVKFSVNEGGSSYKMEGVPYNHQGFNDTVNTMFNDVKITAGAVGTVEEALMTSPESLAKALNDIEKRTKAEGRIGVVDEYVITFPKTSNEFTPNDEAVKQKSATVNPNAPKETTIKGTTTKVITEFDGNPIGKSKFGFDQTSGGNYPMKKHNEQVDPKTGVITRDGMTIDPKKRTFQFSQGQTLTAIINQIILSSEYAKAAMKPENKVNGYIKWWRIDVQIELLDIDPVTGDLARKYTYRVVPYLVHESIFSNPNTVSKYEEQTKTLVKAYEYIYTGQNVDVLKFDIQINNLFFAGINPSTEKDSAKVNNPDQKSSSEVTATTTKVGQGPSTGAQVASGGRARPMKDPELLKGKGTITGGTNQGSTEQKVAEAFHNSFVKGTSADMVTVDLEILGDPFWMVDSGMANYFAKPDPSNNQQTEDGTMNYEGNDVFIYLTFKTPSDVNTASGLYDFGKETKTSPFSGIYRVVICENMFNDGTFKQKLRCVRMPGQALDYVGTPTEVKQSLKDQNKSESNTITFGTAEAPPSSITEPIIPSILVSAKKPPATNANAVPGQAAITATPGQSAPDFRGGYVPGSATVAGGGGYDPATKTFASNSANSIGGSAAISASGNIAPSFAGGFVAGPTVASGGGFDPTTGTNTSDSANSIGGSRAIT